MADMSEGVKVILSRDKRNDKVQRVSVWIDCPKPVKGGNTMKIYVGMPIATMLIEDLEKMGKEFVPKPGGTKSIIMTID